MLETFLIDVKCWLASHMIASLCCMLSELKTDLDNLGIDSMAVLKRSSEVQNVLSNACLVSLCCHPPPL